MAGTEPTQGQYPVAAEEAANRYEMGTINPEEGQERRGWGVKLNGETVTDPVTSASFSNERFGINVQYGQRQEGYDGVVIRERGGGGAVTIPYMVQPEDGQVFVGVVTEVRPTLGGDGKVDNVPRGFIDAGETHDETAVRELGEETGFKPLASRVVKLAEGLNPNTTYFDTSGVNADGTPEGVAIYGVEVEKHELDAAYTNDGKRVYVFPEEVQAQAKGSPTEKIVGTKFVPVTEALTSRDMFTAAAAGQLLVRLTNGVVPTAAMTPPAEAASVVPPAPEV